MADCFFSSLLLSLIDINEYDPCCTLKQGLKFAYRAKKSAESHIGVGKNTDIMILKQGKELILILNESDKMRTIRGDIQRREN